MRGGRGRDTSTAGMGTPRVNDRDQVDEWARDSMVWCYNKEIIGRWQNDDGMLSMLPHMETNRGMMSKIITIVDDGLIKGKSTEEIYVDLR